MSQAEAEAEQLVEDFGLSLPIKPKELCEQISTDDLSVNYSEESFQSLDICGLSIQHGNKVKVVVNSNINTLGRKNFTAAHEIGHVILHIQTGEQSEFQCTKNDLYGSQGKNIDFEKEANQFASSLLMPKSLIHKQIKKNDLSWKLIQELSKKCASSLEATARRVITISNEMCALIIHKKGEMWTPIRSPSFTVYVDSIPFPNNLETAPDIPVEDIPDYLNECDTIDWILNKKNLPDTIYYSSVRNDEFDRTMTLLIVPEIDEDDDDEWEEPNF